VVLKCDVGRGRYLGQCIYREILGKSHKIRLPAPTIYLHFAVLTIDLRPPDTKNKEFFCGLNPAESNLS